MLMATVEKITDVNRLSRQVSFYTCDRTPTATSGAGFCVLNLRIKFFHSCHLTAVWLLQHRETEASFVYAIPREESTS